MADGAQNRKIPLHTVIALVTMVLIAFTAAAIWIPTAVLSSGALVQARKDQMASGTFAVSQSVLAYFQAASVAADEFKTLYGISFREAAGDAHLHYFHNFSQASWVRFDSHPTLASLLLISGVRDQGDIAPNSACNTNGYLISSGYLALIDSSTTSEQMKSYCLLNSPVSCELSSVRLNLIAAASNRTDPLQVTSIRGHHECRKWLGSKEFVWRSQRLPGDPERNDTGLITKPHWINDVSVVGKGSTVSLFKKIFFALPGPSWAPKSAFGAVSLKISGNSIGGNMTLSRLLENSVTTSDLDDVLYLITGKGELIGSSVRNQSVEIHDSRGNIIGIKTADNATSVAEPMVSVSRELFSTFCAPNGEKYDCQWDRKIGPDGISLAMSKYQVSAVVISDPVATGLDILLVMVVEESVIVKPAKDLNVIIACTASSAVLVFAFCAHLLGHTVSKPIKRFARNITASSTTLNFDDISVHYGTVIAEVAEMNHALEMLVHKLSYYKSFLPDEAYDKKRIDEEDGHSPKNPLRKKSSRRSNSSSSSNTSLKSRRVTDAIREKTGVIIGTNVRHWTARVFQYGAAIFEYCQSNYIETLSEIAGVRGKIVLVNGDRSLILFPKVADQNDRGCFRRLLDIRNRECVPNLVAAVAVGRMIIGLVGTNRFRANNVAGAPVTQVCQLCESVGKGLSTDQTMIVITTDLVERYPLEMCPAGILTTCFGNTKFGFLNNMKATNEGWIFDIESSADAEGAVSSIFFKVCEGILNDSDDVTEKFEAFRTAAESMLVSGILSESCCEFVKSVNTDLESFEKVAVIRRR